MKCGTVALIGRPNAGKSSLVNAILKSKAAIVSPKPQTTRNSIRCIYNDKNSQIIFTDTPGFFHVNKTSDKLSDFLNDSVIKTLEESDVICWLIDSGTKKLKTDDLEILKNLKEFSKIPVILIANKSDLTNPKNAFEIYESLYKFSAKISLSAKFNKGIDELIKILKKFIPDGMPLYDPDILMDTTERFMIGEIIREKILMFLSDEVPHCTSVEINEYKSPEEYPERKNLYIRASLITETEGQKKILIGSKGNMIKKIGQSSRNMIEKTTGFHVYLDLWVKVVPGWRKNSVALRRLGYA